MVGVEIILSNKRDISAFCVDLLIVYVVYAETLGYEFKFEISMAMVYVGIKRFYAYRSVVDEKALSPRVCSVAIGRFKNLYFGPFLKFLGGLLQIIVLIKIVEIVRRRINRLRT